MTNLPTSKAYHCFTILIYIKLLLNGEPWTRAFRASNNLPLLNYFMLVEKISALVSFLFLFANVDLTAPVGKVRIQQSIN